MTTKFAVLHNSLDVPVEVFNDKIKLSFEQLPALSERNLAHFQKFKEYATEQVLDALNLHSLTVVNLLNEFAPENTDAVKQDILGVIDGYVGIVAESLPGLVVPRLIAATSLDDIRSDVDELTRESILFLIGSPTFENLHAFLTSTQKYHTYKVHNLTVA